MDYYDAKANWSVIPGYMRAGVTEYVMRGVEPGGFIMAVFCNDLMEAAGRADHYNLASLGGWATFLYNFTPRGCWGSPEKVEAWIKAGGLYGLGAAAAE